MWNDPTRCFSSTKGASFMYCCLPEKIMNLLERSWTSRLDGMASRSLPLHNGWALLTPNGWADDTSNPVWASGQIVLFFFGVAVWVRKDAGLLWAHTCAHVTIAITITKSFFYIFAELKDAKRRKKRMQEQIKHEEALAASLKVWNTEILKEWDTMWVLLPFEK